MYKETASVKVKDGKKVVAEREFQTVIFEGTSADDKGKPTGGSPDELLGAAITYFQTLDPKTNGVISLLQRVTKAHDLELRSPIRQALVDSIEGPDKAVDKALEKFVAIRIQLGKPVTEEWKAKKRAQILAEANED